MKSIPKILLVSPLPPPVGGIASWTVYMLDFIGRKEKDYELIHSNSAIKNKRITDKRVINRLVNGTRDFISQYNSLVKKVKTDKPTIVHLTSSASLALFKDYLFARVLKKRGIRSIIHFRFGRICEVKERNNWEWFLLKMVMRAYDEVIVLDMKSYECLFSSGIEHINLVPNPLSNDFLANVNKNRIIGERNKDVILFVGHVIEDKGVYELVEAVCNLKSVRELRLIGPYEIHVKEELLSFAGKEQNKIKFIGTQSSEEIAKEMANCGIFVLPSYSEGFPNVILEAMVSSCPIIATNVGAIPEMLKKDAGISIPPKSVKGLNEAIETLINDPPLAKKMGEYARRTAMSNYRIENIVNQMERIWFKNEDYV
ncbi:glycosyltransferase family 4 protein [Albibacterium bauzanense]|uniref:Glycosyltransferase involved in cell wall biosynthesis n=1 Tax=Albibacterium bauzanense TaxID=653929 RepID=A0A4R1M5A0_9SPHI|nr:glycosyltransferase family 4 protein [Albibacterium bauzanense]TCK84879.1 glycosyltransferase involved in cell wall biosynthesis [Albibacterium bauzanense]